MAVITQSHKDHQEKPEIVLIHPKKAVSRQAAKNAKQKQDIFFIRDSS
jgi:hypothetical protein